MPPPANRRRMTITNSTDDFMRLIAILREYSLSVQIGFEATGNYHRVLLYNLGVAGFDLKLVSALTKEECTKAAWEVVGRKVEKSFMLSDIYETGKVSAGLPVSPDSDAIRVCRGNDPPNHGQNPPHSA